MAVSTINGIKAKASRYWIPALFILAMVTQILVTSGVFAAGDSSGAINAVLDLIIPFIKLFVGFLGMFFVLFGLVNLIIAHNNSQGPDMQKAQITIAVGAMLVVLAVMLSPDMFTNLISTISSSGQTS